MHVSRRSALSLAALGLTAAVGIPHPAAAQVLTTGGPVRAAPDQPQPSAFALSQIAALQAEKAARTPAQQKIDSNLLRAALLARASLTATPVTAAPTAEATAALRANARALSGGTLSAATMSLLSTVPVSDEAQPDANGMVSVDIGATVTDDLLASIAAAGGTVDGSWPAYNSVRATLPVIQLETVAASPAVRSIRPAEQAHVVGYRATPRPSNSGRPDPLIPGPPIIKPTPRPSHGNYTVGAEGAGQSGTPRPARPHPARPGPGGDRLTAVLAGGGPRPIQPSRPGRRPGPARRPGAHDVWR